MQLQALGLPLAQIAKALLARLGARASPRKDKKQKHNRLKAKAAGYRPIKDASRLP